MSPPTANPRWKPMLAHAYDRFPECAWLGRRLSRGFFHRPVFLVAVGRSGTTAVGRALNEHPHILGVSDAHYVAAVGEAAFRFTAAEDAAACRDTSSIPPGEMLERLRRLAFETAVGTGYGARYLLFKRRLWRGERILRRKCWMTNKVPLTEESARGLLALFPRAKFLWVHRDGIENVESRTRFVGFRDQPFETHCEVWASAARKFRFLERWDSAMTVRHADVVADRDRTFRRILEHLELEHSDAPALYAARTFVKPQEEETKSGVDVSAALAERPPAYARWTPSERQTFKRICGDAMRELGYEIPF